MKEKQKTIEAHHIERIAKLGSRNVDTLDAQYAVQLEIRDLLQQLVDLELERQGKSVPKKDPLPEPTYSKGKRKWKWFN